MGAPAPGWLAANLAALCARARRSVAGQADIDPVGAAALIPRYLHDIDARECAYAALLDEIRALADPDPADPWPRHDEHSGASIAVTTAAYRRAGGMPAAPLGGRQGVFRRAAMRRCAHPARAGRPASSVSARDRRGARRAAWPIRSGGACRCIDVFIDDRLEPAAESAFRRARLRVAAAILCGLAWRGSRRPSVTRRVGQDARLARRGAPAQAIFRPSLGGNRTFQSHAAV